MPETEATRRPPIILIANDYEWWGRSLETILTPRGYAVIRAFTGIQALHTARTSQLDAVILEARLPGLSGIALCRSLREDGIIGKTTPIIITSSGRMTHDEVVTALSAGAWAVCHYPLDGEMLALHLETFVAAKREADRAREESLIDSSTGFYSMRGLVRRGREIAAEALRGHSPLACVAVAPHDLGADFDARDERTDAADATPSTAALLGQALLRCVRASDVVGYLGRGEFAIIARNTNSEGAERLTRRMRATLATGLGSPICGRQNLPFAPTISPSPTMRKRRSIRSRCWNVRQVVCMATRRPDTRLPLRRKRRKRISRRPRPTDASRLPPAPRCRTTPRSRSTSPCSI